MCLCCTALMLRSVRALSSATPMGTMSRVGPNLYIGGFLAASDPKIIQRAGITRIVKLFADTTMYPGGYCRHPGVSYAVFPTLDVPSYDIRNDATSALKFVKDGIDRGETVLVHCHAGISRSATVVLLYLMIYQHMTLDEALSRLRAVRPVVNPNQGFMRMLRSTDARLKHRRIKG